MVGTTMLSSPASVLEPEPLLRFYHYRLRSRQPRWRFWNETKSVCGQVLLFRRSNLNPRSEILNVLLLPHNVPLDEVKRMYNDCEFVQAPSSCTLVPNETYTIHCPQADILQPEGHEFKMNYGSNYPPTFQIILFSSTEIVNIEIQDDIGTAVWKLRVRLPGVSGVKLDPNRAETKLNVSEEDSKLEFFEDDSKLKESVDDSMLKMSEDDLKLKLSSFTPELESESTQLSYRFRCPGPGQFQCSSTGLVFVVAQEAELLYRTVQWDESLLRSVCKMAAGPLFNIQCPEDAVFQLHLPHCETKDALLCDGLLSVAHITDDGMSFIEPLEITDTHVIISVPHLSDFGLTWPRKVKRWFRSKKKTVCGQVLLFRQPNIRPQESIVNVLLLPKNAHLNEVKRMLDNCVFILAPSDCILVINKTYTAHCPEARKVQPKGHTFKMNYGPNYSPAFQIKLLSSIEVANVEVRDETVTAVWEGEVSLPGPGSRPTPGVSAEERLMSFRSEFIDSVSPRSLTRLLNKLLDYGKVTHAEYEYVAEIPHRAEKAQELIDTVRRKGETACSDLISALCEVDRCLSEELNLM